MAIAAVVEAERLVAGVSRGDGEDNSGFRHLEGSEGL